MGVLVWSYPGWRRFSRELSGFELRGFFALEAGDRRELRGRGRVLRAGVPCSRCRGRPQADARVGRSPRLLHKRRLARTAYGR